VGTIYTSSTLNTAAKVADALGGGTWANHGPGRVVVGAGSNGTTNYARGATGGADSVTLTKNNIPPLEVRNMPDNTTPATTGANGDVVGWGVTGFGTGGGWSVAPYTTNNVNAGRFYASGSPGYSRAATAVENRMPYIVEYRWVRTA